MAVKKDSLKLVIAQMSPEDGFERGRRVSVVKCFRQTVPNRRASVRKRSFTNAFVFTGEVTNNNDVYCQLLLTLHYFNDSDRL